MPSAKPAAILAHLAAAARDLVTFSDPTDAQRQAKSRFWATFSDGTIAPPSPIDSASARRYSGDHRVTQWWSLPGFEDWFTNSEEFRDRVEFLGHLALDNVETILRNPEANVTAKINAIRILFEIGGKFPGKGAGAEKYVDEKIAEMDRKQLEEFITKQVRRLPTAARPDGDID